MPYPFGGPTAVPDSSAGPFNGTAGSVSSKGRISEHLRKRLSTWDNRTNESRSPPFPGDARSSTSAGGDVHRVALLENNAGHGIGSHDKTEPFLSGAAVAMQRNRLVGASEQRPTRLVQSLGVEREGHVLPPPANKMP